MLNFKNTIIAFIVLLVVLIIFKAAVSWFFVLVFLLLAVLFWGSYFIQSDFYVTTFCNGATDEKRIAISFDDGVRENTSQILSTLKAHNVTATFFVIGKNIKNQAALLKQIDAHGHIIANHSYSHSYYFDFYSTRKIKNELSTTQKLIESAIQKKTIWFRPPYGVTTPNIAKAVYQLKYATIGWNIRSLDTVTKDDVVLLKRLKRQLKPGAVVLFHDHCVITTNILSTFIQYVKNEGYEIVGLDKLLNLQPYA